MVKCACQDCLGSRSQVMLPQTRRLCLTLNLLLEVRHRIELGCHKPSGSDDHHHAKSVRRQPGEGDAESRRAIPP
jgi:hypothetical protein